MAAFGAAQLAYLWAFVEGALGWAGRLDPLWTGVGLAVGVAAFVALRGAPLVLRLAVAVYAVLLLTMGQAAISTGVLALAAGAALFIASDGLIGLSLLRPGWRERALGHSIWASYFGAQGLLTFGATHIL